MILMAAVMASNFINFFYNALLGRFVTVEDFGIIILVSNFLYILNIFLNALAGTVNHHVSRLDASEQHAKSDSFIAYVSQSIFKISLVFAALWLIFSSYIASFFHIETIVVILFTPLFIFYPYVSIATGFFQGRLSFIKSAALTLFEPLVRLISVGFLLYYHFHSKAYISIYISSVVTSLFATFLMMKVIFSKKSSKNNFPYKFYFNAMIAGCSTISFLALDVILVKHYLNPTLAGRYSLLSLIGKIIFFLGTLFNIFTISIASRELGIPRKKFVPFYYLMIGALIISGVGFIVFGIFGFYINPLLFGQKAVSIWPYTRHYIGAMVLFTLGSMLITYHIAKKEYIFSSVGFIASAFIIVGIVMFHANLQQVVQTIFYTSILYFSVLFMLHIKHNFFSKVDINSMAESV